MIFPCRKKKIDIDSDNIQILAYKKLHDYNPNGQISDKVEEQIPNHIEADNKSIKNEISQPEEPYYCCIEPEEITNKPIAKISTIKRQHDSGIDLIHIQTPKQSLIFRSLKIVRPTRNSFRRNTDTSPAINQIKNNPLDEITKNERINNLLRSAIESNIFFSNHVNEERIKMVIAAMTPKSYPKGSYIIRQNDEGSEMYISEDGVFDVIRNNEIINSFGPGCMFGELAILYNARRSASIVTATNAKIWKIDITTFRTIMRITGDRERTDNLNFLKSVPFLKDLSDDKLVQIVDLWRRCFFLSNTCIVKQGNIGDYFYIIRNGTVTIKKNIHPDIVNVVDWRKRGQYFGEQALLNSDRRTASVYADSPGVECLKLSKKDFLEHLGHLPELHVSPVDKIVPSENARSPSLCSREYSNIELENLQRLGILGAGGFGKVELVRYDGKMFALKTLNKLNITRKRQVDQVFNEKTIMENCFSPFIVQYYRTYRDEKNVYFLMEACLGGNLLRYLRKVKSFDKRTANFSIACVIEAFDYLHKRNIIFRDLKPENIMILANGYCKLIDFGVSKKLYRSTRAYSFVGTSHYMAPEILNGTKQNKALDYWTLGVLIYEFLTGKLPFQGRSEMRIYTRISMGIESIKMPTQISKSGQNLIISLCKQKPSERIGCQEGGINDIRKHKWFHNFNWAKLQDQTMKSPIKLSQLNDGTPEWLKKPCKQETDNTDESSNGSSSNNGDNDNENGDDDYEYDYFRNDDELNGWDNGF